MSDRPRKISKAAVDRLRPGEIAWDAEVRGFGVRCQRRDRVYIIKYRAGGRQRWFTIGKHGSPWTAELARREARRVLGLVAEGKDPAEKKKKDRSAPTVTALAEQFLEEHVNAKSKDRTYLEYKRLIHRIVKPELGRLRVDEVRSSDIERLHLKFRQRRIRRTASWCSCPRCSTGQDAEAIAIRVSALSASPSTSGDAISHLPN